MRYYASAAQFGAVEVCFMCSFAYQVEIGVPVDRVTSISSFQRAALLAVAKLRMHSGIALNAGLDRLQSMKSARDGEQLRKIVGTIGNHSHSSRTQLRRCPSFSSSQSSQQAREDPLY
jgi:hypothetical protein